ncbi:RagB/SusD family nutrient uptake outer membrane protein [Spirosoma pollinicola]|uniref:RagB/SusD family nutrient uptake outer membrane protein n=1 Tax=Spirosoma pollinicola TaxID=2057025 RepID=A0A2K8YTR0_9BACT|nr:RagB/SusD family nutrient uptake outer membrane protein [Spirosoma pollinicola]AUD01003.1 RagB/SusD family nutrient uptake outer membrane protein [Spirosoma pollinicola]
MKRFSYTILVLTSLTGGTFLYSCKDDFLKQPALGALSDQVLTDAKGVETLLVAAYAALDGQASDATAFGGGGAWEASPDNWIYGSLAGGEAHKGSDGSDQASIDPIVKFTADPSNGFFNSKWKAVFEGITRTNSVLRILKGVTDLSDAEKANIEAQARFLRAHYYFDLKKMFNKVPWIDETTTNFNQPNTDDIWPKIEADFNYAFKNLSETQADIARANKWAAGAYLAKTYLYEHKYADAQALFTQVISQGKTTNGLAYGLLPKFFDNFNPAMENGPESVFAIQNVANDGTNTIANANQGDMLNYPYNGPFSCCGFYQPTQDLVNSFRTDATGLPYLDTYNQHAVKNDMGITSIQPFTPDAGPVDPRLDWTVGRRGLPYLDWGNHPGQDWVRAQSYGGPYAPKKNIYWRATQDQYSDQNSWAPGSAINTMLIRFSDVLLMAAEAEAQVGNLSKAQDYVNQVRKRAANKEGWVYKYANEADPSAGFSTTPAANYSVGLYPASTFASQGKDYALKAIYLERKLELGMEGHRFFDLVRWGIAEQTLNAYFVYESTISTDIRGGKFVAGTKDYYPIPQRQIDLSGQGVLTQNPGY